MLTVLHHVGPNHLGLCSGKTMDYEFTVTPPAALSPKAVVAVAIDETVILLTRSRHHH